MNDSRHDNLPNISISISGIEELQQYQRGIMNLLSNVEIDGCDLRTKEDVKALYKLLLLLHEAQHTA